MIFTLKKKNYFVSELPNVTCQTTGRCKAKFPEIGHFFNLHDSSLGRHVNAASLKSLEIQA